MSIVETSSNIIELTVDIRQKTGLNINEAHAVAKSVLKTKLGKLLIL